MRRVIVAAAVGFALLLVPAVPASAAGEFADVPVGSPYYASITDLASRNIISGYGNGTFVPGDPITRQQFAKLLVKTLGLQVTGSETSAFTDVPRATAGASDPFYPDKYIAICFARGWIAATSGTTFGPWQSLSRAELAAAAARALNLAEPPAAYIPPFDAFPGDDYGWARRAAYAGLLTGLQGMGPGFDFQQSASRGECAQVLHSLLALVPPPNAETTSSSASSTSSTTLATGQSATTVSVGPGSTTPTSVPALPLGKNGGFPTGIVAGVSGAAAVLIGGAVAFFLVARARSKRRPNPVLGGTAYQSAGEAALDEEARRLFQEWAAKVDEALAAVPVGEEDPRMKELWDKAMASARKAQAARGAPSVAQDDAD